MGQPNAGLPQGAAFSANSLPQSYPSSDANGRYKAHAELYMPRGLANTGHIHDVPRPSSSLRGGRFASQVPAMAQAPVSWQPSARAQDTRGFESVRAAQDVAVSQMASQLLMYAGHPAFSSYVKIALDASSAATTPGVITPPPTRTWHTAQSAGTQSRRRTWDSTGDRALARRPGSVPSSGWMNALGDVYDPVTGIWHRAVWCEPDDTQTPGYTRAVAWHRRRVLRGALCWWRRGYRLMCACKAAKHARAWAHSRRSLCQRAFLGLVNAVEYRRVLECKIQRACAHYRQGVCEAVLWGWREACLAKQDKLARVAMVRDHMGLFCQRRMLRVWQDHVHATHHKAQLQAWASHRMAKHRLRTCLHALAAYTQHRVARKQKSHLAQRHYQARLQACVMSEWLGFVARFQWHERQLRRARAKADWGLKRRVLWGWREALLEAVREALTEQVYDLKRELAHAIAWSD